MCCSHSLGCHQGHGTYRRYVRLHTYPPVYHHGAFSITQPDALSLKVTKRSVKMLLKSMCVFPECLRDKLPTVNGVTALLFSKAIDKCPSV